MKHKFIFLTTGITVFCLSDFTAFSSDDNPEKVSRTVLTIPKKEDSKEKNKLEYLKEEAIKRFGKEFVDELINSSNYRLLGDQEDREYMKDVEYIKRAHLMGEAWKKQRMEMLEKRRKEKEERWKKESERSLEHSLIYVLYGYQI
jgi:hypothetical protein